MRESEPAVILFGELLITRPKRRRLTAKAPETETFYARDFTFEPGLARARRRRKFAPEAVQPGGAVGHLLFATGSLTWCWNCGRYSTDRAHGLRASCEGHPGAGQAYRLNRLKREDIPLLKPS